jgi:hypothetical protein
MTTLVTQTPLLALATAGDLEALGIAQKALQALPLAQRLRGLCVSTGRLITPIRKRYGTPIVPTLDVARLVSGITGTGVATWTGGPATLVQDYLLTFASGGTTYTLTANAGAYGAITGPATTWTGSITVDGYTLTIAGTINAGDTYAWSTAVVQDPGIALAVSQVAAYVLLHNRGIDPKTEADLKAGYDGAMAWAAALGIPGEGELDPSLDTDATDGGKYGPLGAGTSSPYSWLDDPSRCVPLVYS